MAAAINTSIFITTLFRLSTTFKYKRAQISPTGRDLHIAGESYAGHWIPAIGSYLINMAELKDINLKSFLVANVWTDDAFLSDAINRLLCGPAPFLTLRGSTPASTSTRCSHMPQWISICKSAITKCNLYYGVYRESWGDSWADKFKRNPYDMNKDQASYLVTGKFLNNSFAKFTNNASRKARFGVPQNVKWRDSNGDMMSRFDVSGDQQRSYIPQVQDILNVGIDFLFYAGDQDLVCPSTLVKETALHTDWNEANPSLSTKTVKFRKCAARREITYSKISSPLSAGYASYVRAGHLTYARVFGAGRMINENKPAEGKHLFESWIFNRAVFQECDPGP